MQLQDFGDFTGPKRWPWLLLLVVAVAAVVGIRLLRRGEKAPPVAPEPAAVAVETERPAKVETTSRGAARPVTRPAAPRQAPQPVSQPAAPAAPVPPVVVAAGSFPTNSMEMLKTGSDLEAADRLVEARDHYRSLLAGPLRAADRAEVERRLGSVGVKLVMSPRAMPEKMDYVVQRGDSLERIAKKRGTTVELLQVSNSILKPSRIMAGDALRILSGKLRLEVSKSRNDMILYLNGQFLKRYRIGSGKFGKTPEGTFEITERIKEPVWWRPDGKEVPYGDKDNILGTRWLTLRATGTTPNVKGYGIHGTWEPESIGKSESAGCIRMRNEEVEELFVLVPPGTPVTIVP